MTWSTGTIDTFSNLLVDTPEVADTGDGATTVFSLQTSNKPIFVSGVEIEFTISTTTYQVTSDANGDFAHAEISSGSITEAGALSITFNNPPDDTTDILFNEYTTKGALQKIVDSITSDQYTEVVDTGDGVTTSFSTTLSNTTIAKGQMLLRFKIGGFVYWVWDNGNDEWEHDEISSSSIDYDTGDVSITFATAIDDTFDIDILYTTGSAGQDWIILLEQNAKDSGGSDAFPGLLLKEYVLTNSGSGYADRVVVGLREAQNIAGNQYNIELNLYKSWNESDQDQGEWNFSGNYSTSYSGSTEHWTGLPCIAINDTTQTYWVSSTKDRVNFVVRVSGTIYAPASFGIGNRIGSSKDDYPKPYYVAGTGSGDFVFSSTSGTHSSFVKPSSTDSFILLTPEDGYQGADDFKLSPTEDLSNPGDLKLTTTNKVGMMEVHLVEIDPSERTLFELDGVFYCNYVNFAAEDVLNDGADDYLVVQDVFRTGNGDYFCLKQV